MKATPVNSIALSCTPLDTVLYCVSGSTGFPTVFSCILKMHPMHSNYIIWGYSVWKRKPGFRTLGIDVNEFVSKQHICAFFLNIEDAMNYVRTCITPKKSAL